LLIWIYLRFIFFFYKIIINRGVISGATLPLARAFDLDAYQKEVVVSSTVFAALIASLVGGSLNDNLGRRKCCLIASVVFTLGSAVLFVCWDYRSLVVGRIIVGLGIGIASLTTPIYISEMALPRMRGQLVTTNALLVTVGQFTAGMVDGILDQFFPRAGWRLMLGLAALPALVMGWGFYWSGRLPESPRWLVYHGQIEEASMVLKRFRESDDDAQQELDEIQQGAAAAAACSIIRRRNATAAIMQQQQQQNANSGVGDRPVIIAQHQQYGGRSFSSILSSLSSSVGSYYSNSDVQHFAEQVRQMLADQGTRKALFLGCGLMWVQQLSGINTVMVSTCPCLLCFPSLPTVKQ